MNILNATDFSPQSEKASAVAAAFAKVFGDELRVLHVLEPYPVAFAADLGALSAALPDQTAWARKELDSLAARRRLEGANTQADLVQGFAERTIVEQADARDARLIVMGSLGKSAAERLLLGSVAERVAEKATRPTLVVGGEASGLLEALRGQHRMRVALAIDDSMASDAAIAWTRELKKRIGCDVTVLHSYWPPAEYSRLGFSPTETTRDVEVTVDHRHRVQRRLGELPGEGTVEIRVLPTWARFGDALAAAAEGVKADLLVVGSHQWRGLAWLSHSSTSREVLHAARLPVLCVPMDATAKRRSIPPVRRVLAATDLSAIGNRAVAHAYSLVSGAGGSVELVHVVEHASRRPTLSNEARQKLEAELRALAPEGVNVATRVTIVDGGHAARGIVEVAERYDVDALCIGTRGRTGVAKAILGSVASNVLERTRRPLLLVREQA